LPHPHSGQARAARAKPGPPAARFMRGGVEETLAN
jgi:hypothetical protein